MFPARVSGPLLVVTSIATDGGFHQGKAVVKDMLDLCLIADDYISYLKNKGVEFNENGNPIFKKWMFLDEWPELVIPYDFRQNRLVVNPKKTLLCFYSPDVRIYPRLEKILNERYVYQNFLGAVATDVSVTSDMDKEWQDFIMLLNQLFMAVLAVNGIKIVANLRMGSDESLQNFEGIPSGVMWSAGFLGCKLDKPYDMNFIASVLRVRPSKFVIYGKNDVSATDKLRIMGINYRLFADYHKLRKEKA